MNSNERQVSQIGREVIHGKETDARFLEQEMGFNEHEESQLLSEIALHEADAALAQIEEICHREPSLTSIAFTQLLKLYPTDPRAETWKQRALKPTT